MIYVVDGTGPFSDYGVAMAGSHCNAIYYMNKGAARYWRGPTMADVMPSTASIAAEVHEEILRNEFPPALLAPGQQQSPKSPIHLVGYSRGGAAVVMVAKRLAQQGIPVAGMFLFDAVARTRSGEDLSTVPANVHKCCHAVRNEGAEVVMAYEVDALWKKCELAPGFAALKKEFARIGSGTFGDFLTFRSALPAARTPELARAVAAWRTKQQSLARLRMAMRNSFGVTMETDGTIAPSIPFGNCARKLPGSESQTAEFAGTHAALGGCIWTTLGDEIQKMDQETSRRVWTWMMAHLLRSELRAFPLR